MPEIFPGRADQASQGTSQELAAPGLRARLAPGQAPRLSSPARSGHEGRKTLQGQSSSPSPISGSLSQRLNTVPRASSRFSSVQSLSLAAPRTAACQASLSITNSRSPPKLMSIESMMPSSHPILCRPLLLPSIFPSIRVFSNESALPIRWPKYWSFSSSISPSNEHPGLISFTMDWLDLLAVQGTLKSLLQDHSSKASVLQHSAFFVVQLSHPYMTTYSSKQ